MINVVAKTYIYDKVDWKSSGIAREDQNKKEENRRNSINIDRKLKPTIRQKEGEIAWNTFIFKMYIMEQ
jgi:hypothetical protein